MTRSAPGRIRKRSGVRSTVTSPSSAAPSWGRQPSIVTAVVSRDRAKIHELYAPDWKVWFAKEGDARHGTPDDPRMVLIGVTVHGAEFLEVNKPRPVILFELVKGWLTGSEPELGEMHEYVEPRRP